MKIRTAVVIGAFAAGTLAACDPVPAPIERLVGDMPAVVTPTRTRLPLGHYQFTDGGECVGPVSSTVLPCRDVLGVCGDGGTPFLMPEAFECTSESVTFADVCRERPESEWSFYGLDPSKCVVLVG